ncbi:MAG: hypothetical protein IKO60_04860 [Bacteroidaceae bacterium]|nr:hypothetical protein [Bacteroidaceae bacterium]
MKTNDNISTEDALRKAIQRRAQRRSAECPAPADLEDLVMQRITNTVKSPLPTGGKSHHDRSYRLIIPVVSAAAAVLIGFLLWQHKESPTAITPETDNAESPSLVTHEMPKQQIDEKEAQPVTVQQASQEHLLAVKQKENVVSQKSETESLEQKIAGLTIVPTSADLGPGVTMRLGGSADTLAHKGVDEPLEQKIVSLTIVPTSADLGPGVTMRAGKPCPITAGVEPLQEEEVSPIPADKQALADLYLAEEALQVAYEQRAVREAVRAYTAGIKGEKLPKPVIAF